MASAGISLSATLPLSADALSGWTTWALAFASYCLLVLTKVDTAVVILGAALLHCAAHGWRL